MALTQALDLGQLETVLTSGKGTPATTLAAIQPVACPGTPRQRATLPAPRTSPAAKTGAAPGPKKPLTFLYDSAAGSAVAAAAELGGPAVEGRRRRRSPPRARTRPPLQNADLRHRRLGHRVGPAQRQQPRPARPVPVRAGPGRRRHQLLRDRQPDVHRRRDRRRPPWPAPTGCPTWLDGESALFKAADIVAVRQQRGEDVRQRRPVRDAGPARADQHPDAGEVGDAPWRARSRPTSEAGAPRPTPGLRFGADRRPSDGRLLVSLWVLVTASFLMIHLDPGRPGPGRARDRPRRPPGRGPSGRRLGLDDPLLVQYLHYLQGLFTGDLGTSLVTQLPVSQIVSQRLPATVELAVLAFVVAVRDRDPARRRHGRLDAGVGTAGAPSWRSPPAASCSAPSPTSCSASGWSTCSRSASGGSRSPATTRPSSYVLPVLALAIGPAAILARIVRVEMVTVLEADFIRTARAKRLPVPGHLPRPRAAERADRLAHRRRAAAELAGRRHGAGRERLRLAGSRHARSCSRSSTRTTRWCRRSCSSTAIGVLLVNTVVDVALALLDPRSTMRED